VWQSLADANSYSYSDSCCYCYGDCYIDAYFNANSHAHTASAGYSYSKTSPDAEASPVALIGTVKAETRETNSRVSPPAGSWLSPVGDCEPYHLHADLVNSMRWVPTYRRRPIP
jgi:hypothetical protein